MNKVIVSYSRKDSEVARKLIGAFKDIDLDVWVDWEDIPPAVGWMAQILRGIEESDAFIFLVSPDSVKSDVCNDEIQHAAKNNKRIIPIVVRDVDAKTVTPVIRDLNWIFFREQDKFEDGIAKVKIAINLDIEWVEEHRRLQVRALEWEREKELSLLLRGTDLRKAEQMVRAADKKDPFPTKLQRDYIQFSRRDETRKLTIGIATALAVLIILFLSFTSIREFRRAAAESERAAILADERSIIAAKNAKLAIENEKLAREGEAIARENEKNAKAQRSLARAQIYQFRIGELYTSTLLAIDSEQRVPSPEAEEILRRNISLLPIPVHQMSQLDRINALVFGPDGETFVTASADHTVCRWAVKDGNNLFCQTSPGSVNDAVFSPDGSTVYTGDQSGKVLMLDARNGNVQDELDFPVAVLDLSLSPDGRTLAVARDDGRITMIRLSDIEDAIDFLTFGRANVTAFSPDGRWFAAGSSTGGIAIWDVENGGSKNGPIHRGEVLALEFSPSGNTLVSGGRDGLVYVIQTITGRELFHFLAEDSVRDIDFDANGTWFVTASDDRRIRVVDLATRGERLRMSQESFVEKVIISSNGQWIATTGSDETVRVWNAATGAEIFQIPLNSSGSALAFSKDDRYLVSGEQNGETHIWDISAMSAQTSYVQFDGRTGNVQFSPSGDWLAASDEGRIWLLDKEHLSSLTTLPQGAPVLEYSTSVSDLVVSPDSKWLGISTDDGEVILYDVVNKGDIPVIKSKLEQKIAFSADSQLLIAGDFEGNVTAWDVATREFVDPILDGESSVTSLAVSSTQLAIGLEDKIIIHDFPSGQNEEIESSGDHQLMSFSPVGSLLVSINSSGQMNSWQKKDGKFEAHYSLPGEQAFSMRFNSAGNELLVGVLNNVYVLDPLTGREVARIPHKDKVSDMSLSSDGKTLATASLKVIQLWDTEKIQRIEKDNLVEAACLRMVRNFDREQWSGFFGEEGYRRLCENLPEP